MFPSPSSLGPRRFFAYAASALFCSLLMTPAGAETLTWIGPATGGLWTDAVNWSGDLDLGEGSPDGTPNLPTEDVLFDGNGGQNTTVSYAIGATETLNLGSLTVSSGDILTLTRLITSAGTSNYVFTSLSNAGTLNLNNSANSSNHGQTTAADFAGVSGSTFNATGGVINMRTSTSFRRGSVVATILANQTNDGTILLLNQTSQGAGKARIGLSGGGTATFTNNGTITVEGKGGSSGGGLPWAIMGPTATTNLTLGGAGTIVLKSATGSRLDSFAIFAPHGGSSISGAALTNSASHTFQGNGFIGYAASDTASGNSYVSSSFATITNDGLIRALRNTNSTTLQIAGAASGTSSATVTNNGRMVSDTGEDTALSTPLAGSVLSIGANTGTFTNNGLLEVRAGNSIVILSTTVTLNGTIAGGGSFNSALTLTDTATLSPGNLANADGTGDSTVGLLSVTEAFTLGNNTILNYQLGADDLAGTDYDSVTITGSLTLNGILNVTALTGFDTGLYTLFVYTPGTLVNQELTLGTRPEGYDYQVITDDGAGVVQLQVTAVPEPGTAFASLLVLLPLTAFVRRR